MHESTFGWPGRLVSAQPTKLPSHHNGLELQPSQAKRTEEQGRGFVVTCRIADGMKGSNLRWTQGGQEINAANGKRISLSKRPSDKPTSIVLIFDNVTTENAGVYTCSANIEGQPEEVHRTFDLSVYSGINYDNVKLSQSADIGSDYVMTCNVEGEPKPMVSWRRGTPIPSNGHEKFKVHAEGLTIRNVSRADEGQYDCDATQMVGDSTSNFKRKAISLVVNYPPEFQDKNAEIHYSFLGGEVNLTCQAEGEPQPEYDWGYYDGSFVDIPLTELKNREDFSDPSRTQLVKNMSDASQFRELVCRARNQLGTAEKIYRVIEVDQPAPPNFTFGKPSSHQIRIHVNPPEKQDGPLPTTGYRAVIRPKHFGAWENATVIDFQNGTVHILDSLFHNTEYDIKLASRNPVGLGQFSDVRTITTSAVSGAGAQSLTSFTALCILLAGILLTTGVSS
ncbi:putative Neural cell adhesion molecule 1 [Hypsibius exemplaris]|uniref:Neural cell adhesion molecule 1 n=1 Tax=Hypsibius exemplaris TaxID=2072580 RepID=A0A1W0WDX0_HYPEX|nr:putative Neural cell adhesion molecule 1 [Hypsibius exemplaris]